jgi:hypothetical protein
MHGVPKKRREGSDACTLSGVRQRLPVTLTRVHLKANAPRRDRARRALRHILDQINGRNR